MAWCLTKQASQQFRKALVSGEIDPFKMADMDSEARRTLLAKYVGKENAQQVNSLYESKLLLKRQQQGFQTWVKRTAGISPQIKRDLLSRIERMDKVLTSADPFLQDLASTRLKIDITQDEAKNINDLSKRIQCLYS